MVARSMRPTGTRSIEVPDVSAFFAKGDSAILAWGGDRPHGQVGKGGCGGGCGGKRRLSYDERSRPDMSTFVQGSTDFISWAGDSPFRNDSGWTRKPRLTETGPVELEAFPEDCGCDSGGSTSACKSWFDCAADPVVTVAHAGCPVLRESDARDCGEGCDRQGACTGCGSRGQEATRKLHVNEAGPVQVEADCGCDDQSLLRPVEFSDVLRPEQTLNPERTLISNGSNGRRSGNRGGEGGDEPADDDIEEVYVYGTRTYDVTELGTWEELFAIFVKWPDLPTDIPVPPSDPDPCADEDWESALNDCMAEALEQDCEYTLACVNGKWVCQLDCESGEDKQREEEDYPPDSWDDLWDWIFAQWTCTASCNVEGNEPQCTGRVTGGPSKASSEAAACLAAKREATQKAPRNCYARHCQCKCSKR